MDNVGGCGELGFSPGGIRRRGWGAAGPAWRPDGLLGRGPAGGGGSSSSPFCFLVFCFPFLLLIFFNVSFKVSFILVL